MTSTPQTATEQHSDPGIEAGSFNHFTGQILIANDKQP